MLHVIVTILVTEANFNDSITTAETVSIIVRRASKTTAEPSRE